MNNSDQENDGQLNFYEQYATHTDAEILEILRHHKDYQEGATKAAVKIAVERQLIHSAQDLVSPEFQGSQISSFTFFPEIANTYQRQRLTGSIFRFLYVLSFLPLIYGFLSYGRGELKETYLGAGLALTWFILSLLLSKTRQAIILILLFVILILSSGFIGLKVFSMDPFSVLDLVMWIIGTLLPAYMLIYLKKLIQA